MHKTNQVFHIFVERESSLTSEESYKSFDMIAVWTSVVEFNLFLLAKIIFIHLHVSHRHTTSLCEK